MKKVSGIIQARMTSSRLPGKVLLQVMERPLLSYQLERLRFCQELSELIIATTENKEDDPIAELADREGVKLYRGSEEDVLDRYYQAALKFNCEHIMRITADCPLIQADYCDEAIRTYRHLQADDFRVSDNLAEGLGFEIFSLAALESAWHNAHLRSEREHVSLYFANHPDCYRIYTQEYDQDDSDIRVTVDDPEDFQVVKAILEGLYHGRESYFGITEIREFLRNNPAIYALNHHIVRNEGLLISLENDEIVC